MLHVPNRTRKLSMGWNKHVCGGDTRLGKEKMSDKHLLRPSEKILSNEYLYLLIEVNGLRSNNVN